MASVAIKEIITMGDLVFPSECSATQQFVFMPLVVDGEHTVIEVRGVGGAHTTALANAIYDRLRIRTDVSLLTDELSGLFALVIRYRTNEEKNARVRSCCVRLVLTLLYASVAIALLYAVLFRWPFSE